MTPVPVKDPRILDSGILKFRVAVLAHKFLRMHLTNSCDDVKPGFILLLLCICFCATGKSAAETRNVQSLEA